MYEIVAFYLFSFLTIASFWMTVTTKNALYALSSLAAGMIFVSAFFFLLNADFLGVVQIVVYTGAVASIYAFGMMFFDSIKDIDEDIKNPRLLFLLSGLSALLVVVILIIPIAVDPSLASAPTDSSLSNTADIGRVLFTKYLIPFELAAVMLLVAMIGGIILAGKKMDTSYTVLTEEEIEHQMSDYEIKKDLIGEDER
jgi:NADH-quinone oxidoreductase subunit J